MRSWGKFWTQKRSIQRDQKTQLPLLKSLEQKQGVRRKSRVLRMPPAHTTTTRGVGKTPKPPLQPNPWTHPYPHPM